MYDLSVSGHHWPILLSLVCLAGCEESEKPKASIPPEREESAQDAVAQLRRVLAKEGSVIFRSWDGKWIGFDRDTDLKLLSEGGVVMVQYGVGVERFSGSYQIETDGKLNVVLNDAKSPWPSMTVGRDSRSFFLRAPEEAASSVWPREYWRFREIPASGRKRLTD